MILMALDHTRHYFSNVPPMVDPLDLHKTWPALFLTRWITHYCAPVFVFLAGTGAFLSTTRGKTTKELSWFLLTRGLWLVLLESTVILWFGWSFAVNFHLIGAAVIWAIGWSKVVLAGLVLLPMRYIALFGIAMIAGHNLCDLVRPERFGSFDWLWKVLHTGGLVKLGPGFALGVGYPLIPWMGVMAAGYAFGSILLWEPGRRRRAILFLGSALTALFIALRTTNLYGNPKSWTGQSSLLFTLFSFIDCHKYPPSLLYLLMTLGPALMVLSLLDKGTPRILQPALIFGRVPLFYYLLHLPLIHGLAVIVFYLRYGRADWLYGSSPADWPDGLGYGLPGVYLAWLCVILVLYPVCRWFAELKRRRRDAWLSYL